MHISNVGTPKADDCNENSCIPVYNCPDGYRQTLKLDENGATTIIPTCIQCELSLCKSCEDSDRCTSCYTE